MHNPGQAGIATTTETGHLRLNLSMIFVPEDKLLQMGLWLQLPRCRTAHKVVAQQNSLLVVRADSKGHKQLCCW